MIGAIKGADGSAAAPSYGFASDPNTGFYRKGADSLGAATAGAERVYIDAAGKLFALGAADIAGALAIAGATSVAALSASGTISAAGAIEVGHASDTTLARASAGNLTVEGNAIYRAGGTDVAVADGGTGASTAAAARIALASLGAMSVQTFTASGTWTKPSGCTFALVIGTAGGGGGGESNATNVGGHGGGAGGTCIELIDVTAISSETVTIGGGGAGGTGAGAGSAGGNTLFGAHFTASAGAGGPAGGANRGGLGGTAANGNINIPGGDGTPGNSVAGGVSGSGGSSFWGGGATGTALSESGTDARAYGAGGAGGFSTGSTVGGVGMAGVVFVLEFKT